MSYRKQIKLTEKNLSDIQEIKIKLFDMNYKNINPDINPDINQEEIIIYETELKNEVYFGQIKFMLTEMTIGIKNPTEYNFNIRPVYIKKLGLSRCVQIVESIAINLEKDYYFYNNINNQKIKCNSDDKDIIGCCMSIPIISEHLKSNYHILLQKHFSPYTNTQIILCLKEYFNRETDFIQSIIKLSNINSDRLFDDLLNNYINHILLEFISRRLYCSYFQGSTYHIPYKYIQKYGKYNCIDSIITFLNKYTEVSFRDMIRSYNIYDNNIMCCIIITL
jgi:hypothetical protein